ncbi:hypothetical protein ACLOAU_11040 [Niabella sp. CJ426]|uniref:hypothetical protein n=1 Tax=Niabella sp. CJ426 TaxID=3393740 RepID=UPI003D037F88
MKKTFLLLLITISVISCKKDAVTETPEETTKIPDNVADFYTKIAGTWKLNEMLCAGCGPVTMPRQTISISNKGSIETNLDGKITLGNLDLTGADGCFKNSFLYSSGFPQSIGLEGSGVLTILDCNSGGYRKYVKVTN